MDRDAVEQLFGQYAFGLDNHKIPLTEATFAEDGTFAVQIGGEVVAGPFEGRQALIDFIGPTTMAQTDKRHHVITNLFFETPTRVHATLTLFVADAGEVNHQTSGVYSCDLIEQAGEPLFRTMVLALDTGF
jgi:hypothetical protein